MKKIKYTLGFLLAILLASSCSYRGVSSSVLDSSVTSSVTDSSTSSVVTDSSTSEEEITDTNTYGYGISDNEKIYLAQVASGTFARTLNFTPDEGNEILNTRFEVTADGDDEVSTYVYRGHNEWEEGYSGFSIIMSFELYVAISLETLTISAYTYDGTIASSDSTLANFLDDGLGVIGTDASDIDVITGSTHTSEYLLEILQASVKQAISDTTESGE